MLYGLECSSHGSGLSQSLASVQGALFTENSPTLPIETRQEQSIAGTFLLRVHVKAISQPDYTIRTVCITT
jgi:hypothetical protein